MNELQQTSPHHAPFLAFVGAFFGLAIYLWTQPLNFDTFRNSWIDCLLAFLVLVSLWWWYAIALPRAHISEHIGHYLSDFAALASVALAVHSWNVSAVFFGMGALASALVAIRFCLAGYNATTASLKIQFYGLAIIAMLLLGAVAFVLLGYFIREIQTGSLDRKLFHEFANQKGAQIVARSVILVGISWTSFFAVKSQKLSRAD